MMSSNEKIVDLHALVHVVEKFKKQDKRIVQCHGCFDWFHIGHLYHLRAAKKYGDILVVTVTRDKYVKKGPRRPIFTEIQRMEMLAAIEVVDYVALNLWESAVQTIKLLKSDYFVKGPDYLHLARNINKNIYLEIKAAEDVGTVIKYTTDQKFSSTEIIKKLC